MNNKVRKLKPSRILEIYVSLEPTEPLVWRKFLVRDSLTMYQLHEILQVVMGWMHSHLFMFRTDDLVIDEPDPDDEWYRVQFKDARRTKISSVLGSVGDSLIYEYDFGDSWQHTVRLERIVHESEVMFSVPRCIDGKSACPPEDCGSFPGFHHLKEVIADPEHEEYEELIRWLDGYYPNYDPNEFSLSAVNKILKIGAGKYLKWMSKLFA